MWRSYMAPGLFNTENAIYDLSKNISDQIREAYYGGHVDVYIPYIEGQWYSYDVNSLYPSSMLNPLPSGKPEHIYNPNMDTFFGFVYCTVNIPKDTPYPSLPIRKNGRVIFPTGTFTGLWFSEEVKYALSQGGQLLGAHWGIQFKPNSNIFTNLINYINSIKVKASDPENYDSTRREIAKLLMNSLYGRFGLRYLDDVTHIYDKEEAGRIHLLFKISRIIPFENGQELIIHSRLPNLDSIRIIEPNAEELDLLKTETNLYLNTNVALAAAITGYSRIQINEYKNHIHNLGGKVAYSDTDSIVCNVKLDDDLVSGTKLGLMKLEREPIRGYFVAPKLYIQIYKDYKTGEF